MKYVIFKILVITFSLNGCTLKSDTFSFSVENDRLVFTCDDVQKIHGVYGQDYDVAIYFTQEGAKKLCNFTTKHVKENMKIVLNDKVVRSNILIQEPISCQHDKHTNTRISFSSIKELKTLAKALCLQ